MTVPRLATVGVARHAALDYAITSAVAVALPLLVGTLTGDLAEGARVALGAFLVTNAAYQGPYGLRARSLVAAVMVIAIGVTIGGLVSGRSWLAVVVVSLVVSVGSMIPQVGVTLAIATLLAAIRPMAAPLPGDVLLEAAGGLWLTLLFLAPWPHRRLRPFVVSASEAVESLYGLLEAVAGPGETWEERRRSATDTLNAVRAACALYPVGPAAGGISRLEALAKALARILHEIVALRTLVTAVRRPPPEVTSAIALPVDRLHRLGRLVQSAGATPLTRRAAPPEPGGEALRRLVERVDRLRGEALLGHGDPVYAALADQMCRTVDRIIAATDAAGGIVADGLKVGITRPRPLRTGALAALWQTVRTELRTRSPRVRRAARAAVAVAIAMTIWAQLPLHHAYWLPIAALLCVRHTYGDTASRVFQRVGGTAAGAILGAVLLALAPGKPALLAAIFIGALAAYALRSVSYTVWTALSTPLVMMLLDYSTPVNWHVAAERIALTVAGGLIALVTARLFWPSSRDDAVLLSGLADMCERRASLIRGVAERIEGSGAPLGERFVAAGEPVEQVGESLERMAQEPVPDTGRIATLQEAVSAARRIDDDLITLSRLAGERGLDPSPDPGPVPAILDHISDRLGAVACGLREQFAPERCDPDIDQQLAALDDFLAGVTRRRRAELAAGTGLDETTPLRRALVQAAGLRHVLHALRADSAALCRALRKACPASSPATGARPRPVSQGHRLG